LNAIQHCEEIRENQVFFLNFI